MLQQVDELMVLFEDPRVFVGCYEEAHTEDDAQHSNQVGENRVLLVCTKVLKLVKYLLGRISSHCPRRMPIKRDTNRICVL